jgi:hypothetical protein
MSPHAHHTKLDFSTSKARSDVVVFGNSAFNEKLSAIRAGVKAQEAVVEHSQVQIDSVAGREGEAERKYAEYALREGELGGLLVEFFKLVKEHSNLRKVQGIRPTLPTQLRHPLACNT